MPSGRERTRPTLFVALLSVLMFSLAGCAGLPSTAEPVGEQVLDPTPSPSSSGPGSSPSPSAPPPTSAPPVTTAGTYTDIPPPNDRPQPTPSTTSGTSTTSTSSTSTTQTNTSSTSTHTNSSTTSTQTPAGPRGVAALDAGHPVVGAWLGGWPSAQNGAIEEFEEDTGQRLDIVDVYLDWFTPVANVTSTLHHIFDAGATPSLTWEAQTLTTPQILNGSRGLPLRDGRTVTVDDYLAEFATGACEVAEQEDGVFVLRILHEMNGGWFAWGVSYTTGSGERPNTPESYKQAWIKIHDAFDERCGDHVRFVWAVNHASVGPGTDFTNTFPGSAYVDYVAIDGYNWGSDAWWGWQDFDTLFRPAYCAVTALTDKPLYVAETASSEHGGDKAAWIETFFDKRASYPRLSGLVWLNDHKYESETDGMMDWRVQSSEAALDAFRDGAATWQSERAGDAEPPVDADPC